MVVEVWLQLFLRMIPSALSAWATVIRLLENCPNEFRSLVSAILLCTEGSCTDRRTRGNNSINVNSCTDRRTRNNQSESNSESSWHENDGCHEEWTKADVNLEKHQCNRDRSNERSMASSSRVAQTDVATDLIGWLRTFSESRDISLFKRSSIASGFQCFITLTFTNGLFLITCSLIPFMMILAIHFVYTCVMRVSLPAHSAWSWRRSHLLRSFGKDTPHVTIFQGFLIGLGVSWNCDFRPYMQPSNLCSWDTVPSTRSVILRSFQ